MNSTAPAEETTMTGLATLGDTSREHHVPLDRLAYLVKQRQLQPVQVAGRVRLFRRADLAEVASEALRVEAERRARFSV